MRHSRSAAVSLALCAMLLRALLPDGWMPGANAAVSPFVICSVDSPRHDGKAPPVQQRSHAPCAFAAAAPLAPPAAPASVIARSHEATGVVPSGANYDFRPATSHRPNAARAPPAFS